MEHFTYFGYFTSFLYYFRIFWILLLGYFGMLDGFIHFFLSIFSHSSSYMLF